jgi:hypothetical protein
VTDFGHGETIQVDPAGLADFTALLAHAHQVGQDVVVSIDDADSITLLRVQLTSLRANEFLFA